MSLPEAREAGKPDDGARLSRRAVLLAAIAGASLVTAGCGAGGFKPMYGSTGIGANVNEKWAGIEIAPIPGRVGQRIRNELIFTATGGAGESKEKPLYRLEIAMTESVASTLVQIDGSASGSVYHLDANFQLIRISDKKVVFRGASHGRAGFERFTSIYSNVRARENAENRAAQTVGQELKLRLDAYLSTAS